MTHSAGPAYRVQEWTPHVTPEVRNNIFRGVALVCVHQPQTATNDGVYNGHTGAAHMFGIHHLHPHANSEGSPHALCQLGEDSRTEERVEKGQRS